MLNALRSVGTAPCVWRPGGGVLKRLAILVLGVPTLAAAAVDGRIQPLAYEMPNGESGAFTYFDDSYSGLGSKETALSPLSGGVGDLTDGIAATENWFTDPSLYVGWRTVDPTISFYLPQGTTLSKIIVHVDDSNGAGGVFTPESVEVRSGNVIVSKTLADPRRSRPLAIDFPSLALTDQRVDVTINRRIGAWVMVSEVEFYGVTVPGPATLALPCAAALLAARRRR